MVLIKRVPGKQQGLAFLWTVLALSAFMGLAAYGVDVSTWYTRKASMQSAADAAALAGAFTVGESGGSDWTSATVIAKQYVKRNGYNENDATYTSQADAISNWYRVQLHYKEATWFGGAIGRQAQDLYVTATAQFFAPADAGVDYQYLGVAPNRCTGIQVPYNFSSFGPQAQHAYGDNYGPLYMQNKDASGNWVLNPNHPPGWQGFDFDINIDPSYSTAMGTSQMEVELFDPDTYNSGGVLDASATTWDEIRSSQTGLPGALTNGADTTIYNLVWTSTAGVDTVIGTAQYDGNSWWADGNASKSSLGATSDSAFQGNMADATAAGTTAKGPSSGWVTPVAGYGLSRGTFTISDVTPYLSGGRLHVRVQNTAGASENGFSLRAGPPHPYVSTYGVSKMGDCEWNSKYSKKITVNGQDVSVAQIASHGVIPMNFDVNGTAVVTLGDVPTKAAGSQFNIARFDTDVAPPSGGMSMIYKVKLNNGTTVTFPTYSGTTPTTISAGGISIDMKPLTISDAVETDVVHLPASYPGGTWSVTYSAGGGDSSTWQLQYGGTGSFISLVGQTGRLY